MRRANLWKLNPTSTETVEIRPIFGWKINFAIGTLKHNKTTYFAKCVTGLVLCYIMWPKLMFRLKPWRLNACSTVIVEMNPIFVWKITTLILVPNTLDRTTYFTYFIQYITDLLLWYVIWSRAMSGVNLWRLHISSTRTVEMRPRFGWKINTLLLVHICRDRPSYFVKYITGLVLCYAVWPWALCGLKLWRLDASITDIVKMRPNFGWKSPLCSWFPKRLAEQLIL